MTARMRIEEQRDPRPTLRFEVAEAALIPRMSRAWLYNRTAPVSSRLRKTVRAHTSPRTELKQYVESRERLK